MFRQRTFDFAQLDAKTAQLYLLIAPAGKFDTAIRTHSGPIASAIETLAIEFDEFFRGYFWSIQITATDTGAADIQLAGFVDRARLLVFVKNINVSVRDRPPDGNVNLSIEIARYRK